LLNSEGSKQLNFPVLKQNVLDDVQSPLNERTRQTAVRKPYHVRQSKDYAIVTQPQVKRYQMLYSKRVIDPQSFMTYPYGYQPVFDDQDMDNVNLLIDV